MLDDQSIIDKINQSVPDVPDNLKPEQVRNLLAQEPVKFRGRNNRNKYLRIGAGMVTACAGCILVLIFSGVLGHKTDKITSVSGVEDYNSVYSAIVKSEYYSKEELENGDVSEPLTGDSGDEEVTGGSEDAMKDTSSANSQVEGLDEINTLQSDGTYLYAVDNDENLIRIYQVQDGTSKLINSIDPGVQINTQGDVLNGEASIIDWYVDTGIEGIYLMEDHTILAVVYTEMNEEGTYDTVIAYYDVSEETSPKKIKVDIQSGIYESSRYYEGNLYVFSDYYVSIPSDPKEYQRYVPSINGIMVPEEDFIIPDTVTSTVETVVTRYEVGSDRLNSLVLMGYTEDYYMTNQALYAYAINDWDIDYQVSGVYTNSTKIQKISLEDLKVEATGSIPGILESRYSLSEKDGFLRVVTTETTQTTSKDGLTVSSSWERSSGLFILDENMKLTGKVEDLAKGESVYSAEYIGDYAYFVTFENTDPLFVVDVSDPADPQVVSELKTTGFSDYMKNWSNGLLLGMGIEADESGNTMGTKLTMYDISDPTKIVIQDSFSTEVISKYAFSYVYLPWSTDASKLIIDPEKNIIGFSYTEANYGTDEFTSTSKYHVYKYVDGKFQLIGEYENHNQDTLNGINIGNYIYILNSSCTETGIIPIP